jgi:hypothetical protein
MHRGRAPEPATALGDLGFRQVAPAGVRAQNLATSRDFEALGHGLPGLDAFGTSHKSVNFLFKKSAQYKDPSPPMQALILG